MKVTLRLSHLQTRHLRRVALGLAAACLLAGCASAPSASPATASTQPSSSEGQPPPLKIGMTADEIRAAWGTPTEILPLENAPMPGETWRYRAVLRSTQRQVAATVEEIPFYDPISGRYTPQKEITQTQETVSQLQITDLIMIGDRLVGWKRSLNEERSFP